MKKIISGLRYFWNYIVHDYFGEGTEDDENLVVLRVELSEYGRKGIKRLMDRCEIRTVQGVVNTAFTLYDMLSLHEQNGGKVIVEDSFGLQKVIDITGMHPAEDYIEDDEDEDS